MADVSISLRGASTLATDTAHVVFLERGLSKLCDLRDIARDLGRNVNRSWSMIVAPNVTNMVGVFTMGFGIMTSVITNNVSALAALADGLLPLREVARSGAPRRHDRESRPAEPTHRDLVPLPSVAAARRAGETSAAFPSLVPPVGDRVAEGRMRFPVPRASETLAGSAPRFRGRDQSQRA